MNRKLLLCAAMIALLLTGCGPAASPPSTQAEPSTIPQPTATPGTEPSATEVFPTPSSVATPGQHPYTSEEAQLSFLLYVPEDYGKDPQQKWPLILYLHGFSGGLQSVDWVRKEYLPARLESNADFPFIVVSPRRGEDDSGYWYQDENVKPIFLLLEEIQSLYSVDPKRIYLSGRSAGAGGVWAIGLQYPERFAALVPVAGFYGWPSEVPGNICDLKDVPVWAFHGAKDEFIPLAAQADLVEALKACGGNVEFTVYPDTGHTMDRAYDTPDLWTWLLSQVLK